MPSTVKGSSRSAELDGHDYKNDASEDDERAEAGLGSFSAASVHYGPVYQDILGQSASSVAFFARLFPITLCRTPP
jgi:hypothetical protein